MSPAGERSGGQLVFVVSNEANLRDDDAHNEQKDDHQNPNWYEEYCDKSHLKEHFIMPYLFDWVECVNLNNHKCQDMKVLRQTIKLNPVRMNEMDIVYVKLDCFYV